MTKIIKINKTPKTPVCKCGAEGREGYNCPYSEEINNKIYICECCKDCAHECLMDI